MAHTDSPLTVADPTNGIPLRIAKALDGSTDVDFVVTTDGVLRIDEQTGSWAPIRWFDVKSIGGAAGDGVTDDTTAIQDTIDACEAAGGGVVFFPSGTYLLSSGLTVDTAGVTIRGAGMAATILDCNGGNFTGITVQASNCIVEHLQVKDNTSAGEEYGVHVEGAVDNVIVQYCLVDNVDDAGIKFEYQTSPSVDRTAFPTNCKALFNLITDTADGSGIEVYGDNITIAYNTLTHSGTVDRAAIRILLDDPSDVSSNDGVLVQGNNISGGWQAGVHLSGGSNGTALTNFRVLDNQIRNISGTSAVGYGISLVNHTYYGVIAGNLIENCATNGIRAFSANTSKHIVVSDNLFKQNVGAVNLIGTQTQFRIVDNEFADVDLSAGAARNFIRVDGANADDIVIDRNWMWTDQTDGHIGIRLSNIGAGKTIYVGPSNHFNIASGTDISTSGISGTIVYGHQGGLNANGTATLANGTTSIAVNHGLGATPDIQDISVTPIEAWGSMTQFYIDTPTSSQFTIHSDQDPGQDVDFAWTASVQ